MQPSLLPLQRYWSISIPSQISVGGTLTCIILSNVQEFSLLLTTSSSFICCVCVCVEGGGKHKELCFFYSNNKFSIYVSPFLCLVNATALEVAGFLGSPSLAYSSLFYKGQGWNLTSVVHTHLYGGKDDMRGTCTLDYIWHFKKSNTSSHFLLKQCKSSQMTQRHKKSYALNCENFVTNSYLCGICPFPALTCIIKISTLTNILYMTPSQNVISLMNNNFTDQER